MASGKESLKGECEGLKTMHVAAGKEGKQYVAAFQMWKAIELNYHIANAQKLAKEEMKFFYHHPSTHHNVKVSERLCKTLPASEEQHVKDPLRIWINLNP